MSLGLTTNGAGQTRGSSPWPPPWRYALVKAWLPGMSKDFGTGPTTEMTRQDQITLTETKDEIKGQSWKKDQKDSQGYGEMQGYPARSPAGNGVWLQTFMMAPDVHSSCITQSLPFPDAALCPLSRVPFCLRYCSKRLGYRPDLSKW